MNSITRRPDIETLAWVWYPLVMVIAVASHLLMMQQGVPILYATYGPVLFAAIAITLLEVYYPYRVQWRPDRSDIVNDVLFMLLIQVALPQFLVFLVALVLTRETQFDIWPQQLPLFLQFVLMVLMADFLRYWLHVASHNFQPLWQLHAVHHSPQKLYWLNVGRFHPLDKSLQFLLDSLPFILLGIREDVLALYFVFYAANGYFQHSNVHVRLGLLNYLISGAELHRWHHSIHIHESNRNYGNNIILWDLLFGTYFLPPAREVGTLGLKNRAYPLTFTAQMKTPFIMRMESSNLPLVSYREIFINLLLRIRFELLYLTKRAYIVSASRNPERHQLQVLNSIIRDNEHSGYGQEHRFPEITDYASFARNCPIVTYEDLAGYIDTGDLTRCRLTTEKPVFFQLTSGTSGKPKYLPLTPTGMRSLDAIQNRVALARYLDNPGTFAGKMFAVVSPAIEGYLESGVPYGSASGLTYMNMPALTRTKYVVPYEVFGLADYELKYLMIALCAVSESRVTIVATANPSTMLRILEVINANAASLLRMLETGEPEQKWAQAVPETVLQGIRAKPAHLRSARARLLGEIHRSRGSLSYADIWPNLQSLVTWTGGSCGIPLKTLLRHMPDDINVSDMGYLSSEVHATITLRRTLGIPTFLNHFFEFIEVGDYETGHRQTKLLHELEIGRRYYIIVTTCNGLYRYFMNDIVETTELFNRTPALKFIQKGQGVTNITGEKLYEGQVLDAIVALEQAHDIGVVFHQWLADEENAHYQVFIETDGIHTILPDEIAATLESALNRLNIEYEQKRKSVRLKPLQVQLLRPGTGETFKQASMKNRLRDGQFKIMTLRYLRDATFPLQDYVQPQ